MLDPEAVTKLASQLYDTVTSTEPRSGLHVIPGSQPLTFGAVLLPPLLYYVALLLLPTAPPPVMDTFLLAAFRNVVAATAAFLFIRMPIAYHVPQSIGLTYQLGLVGIYGFCRVVDAFFISRYMFHHIPKRVLYTHTPRRKHTVKSHDTHDNRREWSDGGLKDPFLAVRNHEGFVQTPGTSAAQTPQVLTNDNTPASKQEDGITSYFTNLTVADALAGPEPQPVYETARTDPKQPTTLRERAAWALELEMSMRGIGFTWTTADVRHTRKTWLPGVHNRLHSILVHVCPILLGSWAIIKSIYSTHLVSEPSLFEPKIIDGRPVEIFDANLSFPLQLILTLALGAFLMAAFSFAHSAFAIVCAPLAPSPLSFFPPLYTTRVWSVTSVRKFWSFGWHRLFARLFLVYGVWPGEWLERQITGNHDPNRPADVGKVLGAFASSAFVHSFSARGVVGGDWHAANGEAKFFALNGLAIIVEEVIKRSVHKVRAAQGWNQSPWYDTVIGRTWWITVLLVTGRNFARGWVKSSLVREMAFS